MRVGAAGLLLVAALAGCDGGGGGRHAPTFPPGSVSLPRLPAQGLVVPRGDGVVLVGLDGRVVRRLPRFAFYPAGNTTHDDVMHGLDWGGPLEQPRLVTASDRYYRLDASRHALIPVPAPRVPLVAGAELVARSQFGAGKVVFRGLSVVRDGHVLVRRDLDVTIVAGVLVQSRGRLLEVRTGRSWRLPRRCIAAGVRRDAAYAFCATGPPYHYKGGGFEPYPYTWLERVTHDGGAARVAEFSRDGPFARITAALSPDGHFVTDQGEPTCGGGYLYVGATNGSQVARLVSGDVRTGSRPNSTFLGWARDGRVVAHIQWGDDCEHPLKEGVYLVDPGTLKRTYVTRSAWAMWNAFP